MMAFDEDLPKSWARAVESVNKAGYMDGASDGQKATFQSSFDAGYKQGLNFGIQIGYTEALNSIRGQNIFQNREMNDPRKINCQLCSNYNAQEKVDNLFNVQEEKNTEYMHANNVSHFQLLD